MSSPQYNSGGPLKLSPSHTPTIGSYDTFRRISMQSGSDSKSSLWDPDEDEFPEGSPFRSGSSSIASTPIYPEKQEDGKVVRDLQGMKLQTSIPMKASLSKTSTKSSIWEPDESEFPNWAQTFTKQYESFQGTKGWTLDIGAKVIYPNNVRKKDQTIIKLPSEENEDSYHGSTYTSARSLQNKEADKDNRRDSSKEASLRTEEHTRDMIAELLDPAWGNPEAKDTHDMLMQRFYRWDYEELPGDYPARHMHVLNWQAFMHTTDRVIDLARPRLCDAVATILFETSPDCLTQFIDGGVKVFEWRNSSVEKNGGLSLVLRREGCTVWVCLYRSHGFKYLIYCLCKSTVSLTGQWREIFAGGRGYIPNTNTGPQWDDYHPLHNEGQDLRDPKFALFMGRQLAYDLLRNNIKNWQCVEDVGEEVEWETDGVVTMAKCIRRSDFG